MQRLQFGSKNIITKKSNCNNHIDDNFRDKDDNNKDNGQ